MRHVSSIQRLVTKGGRFRPVAAMRHTKARRLVRTIRQSIFSIRVPKHPVQPIGHSGEVTKSVANQLDNRTLLEKNFNITKTTNERSDLNSPVQRPRPRRLSTLNGNVGQVAKSKLPPAAE